MTHIIRNQDGGPPFTVKSLIGLCWGLTATFSHDQNQKEVGDLFKDQFFEFFKDDTLMNQNDKMFIQNVLMALCKALRNMGFVRENHVRLLDNRNKEIQGKTKTFGKQASFWSTSKESIISKIVSFIGGTLSINYAIPYIGSGHVTATFNKNATVQFNQNVTLPTAKTSLAKIPELSNIGLNEIAMFIVVGIASTFAVVIILKFLNKWYVKWVTDNIKKEQNKFWKEKFRPDMCDSLYYFYLDVKALVERYYQDYSKSDRSEEILAWDKKMVKEYILVKVLPKNELDWEPYDYKSEDQPSKN